MRRRGSTYLFDSLMTRAPRRAGCGLRSRRPFGRARARPQLRRVPAAARGKIRRWLGRSPPTTSSSRLDILKEKGHPDLPRAAQGCRQGRGARPPHGALHLHRRRDRATCRWSWQALPVLSKAYYATREFDQTTLEPPLGSGPYKIGDFKQGTLRELPAPRRLLGQGSARQPRPLQLRRAALRVLSRPHRRASRASRPARFDLREEFTARDWATAYDIPAVKDGRMQRLVSARRQPVGRAGLLPQHAPIEARRHTRAQGARLRLRFRVDQQEHLLRPVYSAPRASSRTRT